MVSDTAGNEATASASFIVPHDISGVADPLVLTVEEGSEGTVIHWDPVPGAQFYDIVRGTVSELRMGAEAIMLGALRCLEERSVDASTSGNEDREEPPPGQAFFYLVAYDDGMSSSYGSYDVVMPRHAGPGACGANTRLLVAP